MNNATSKILDLQQIFTWMLNDGTVDKTDVKTFYTQALGIFRNAP